MSLATYLGTLGRTNANDPNNQDYLGEVKKVDTYDVNGNLDGGYKFQARLYNATSGALTKNACYQFTERWQAGQSLAVIAAVAAATPAREIVVATAATPAGGYDWFDFAGDVDVLTDGSGTAILAGDWLKLAPGTNATTLLHDTAFTAVETANSVARARVGNAVAATVIRVKMRGGAYTVNS